MAELREETKPAQKEQKTEKKETISNPKDKQLWIVWVVIGGMLLLLGVGLLAAFVVRHYFPVYKTQPGIIQIEVDRDGFGGFRGGYRSIEFTSSSSQSDGLNTTTTTTTYVSTTGVVTAVDDSSITVAGAGKSQKIALNSDTDYSGDDKPAVNDTVIITSTKDGDALTATNVRVLNQ